MDDCGSVDARLGQGNAPERIARARINTDDTAVTGSGIEDAFAAEPGEVGMGVGIVFGPVSGSGGPDEFAGFFVESVKAIGGRALRAPIGGDAAGDDEIVVDQ